MDAVRIIDENGERDVSIFEWAELCSAFFVSYSVYPPRLYAKKFARGGILSGLWYPIL